jgi:hypothetical protein
MAGCRHKAMKFTFYKKAGNFLTSKQTFSSEAGPCSFCLVCYTSNIYCSSPVLCTNKT